MTPPTGEQPDANKVETGPQRVPNSETPDAKSVLERKQAGENEQAAREHRESRSSTTQELAEARADVLVNTPAVSPSSEKASGAPSATPPQSPPTQTTTVKTDWGEKLKGFGAKISTFLGGIMTKLKGIFSSLSTTFSEYFKKIKDKISPNSKPQQTPENPTLAPSTIPDTNQSDTPGENPAGADETWGLKGRALAQNPQFRARAQAIANKIGVPLQHLFAIIKVESGFNPQAVNKDTKCTGLIQFHPKYSKAAVGYTQPEIFKMSGLQQLDLVEKYFMKYPRGTFRDGSDLYRAVFYPASLGKGPDYVFGGKKVAEQNSGIAKYSTRPDGLIDNRCFDRFCAARGLKSGSSSSLIA